MVSKIKRANLADMARARPIVRRRSRGLCEVQTPICLGRAGNMHHRWPEGTGGPSTDANLLHLCGSGTTGCHGWIEHNRKLSYSVGWLVHSGVDPGSVPWAPWSPETIPLSTFMRPGYRLRKGLTLPS